jgi:CheY-like chemotaxis protein
MEKKLINILLIEDNEGDVLLTREALENVKCIGELEVMKNGELAINYLSEILKNRSKELPDLIFLDINLPKKNGHEVLQFIKGNEKLKFLPVIMLTTSSSDFDVFNSYQKQANCFIMKPVDIHSFMDVIGKTIEFWCDIAQLPTQKNQL